VRRGYTLIETTVVLLVLALAAGLAAPAIGRGLDAIRLRAEVAGVASFLRAARERAITQQHALEVEIDGDGRTLVLKAGEDDAELKSFLRETVHDYRPATRTVVPITAHNKAHFLR